MVYDYKINDEILEKMSNGKFLKKDMRLIIKDCMKSFGLKKIKGMKEIDVLGKVNVDDSIIIMEISKFENDFDYWILLFDNQGNLIYDESDGEIKKEKSIYRYFDYINSIYLKDNEFENIRLRLFYPYMV